MRARTPADVGLIMRERRRTLGWDQLTLAKKVGVSRQWIVDVEKGKPGTEIGLVLRALRVLELDLFVEAGPPEDDKAPTPIDAVIARARAQRDD